MILGDILSFVSILLIIFVVMSGFWQAVFVVTIISAIVSQFSQPSSIKIIKQNVDDTFVQTAMVFSQTLMSLFIIFWGVMAAVTSQRFNSNSVIFSATIIEGWSIRPLLTGSMRFITSIFLAFIHSIIATLMITLVDKLYVGRVNG